MGTQGPWGQRDMGMPRGQAGTRGHGHHEEGVLRERGDTRTTGMGHVGTRGHEDHGDYGDTGNHEKTLTLGTKPDHGDKDIAGTLALRGGAHRNHGDRKPMGRGYRATRG